MTEFFTHPIWLLALPPAWVWVIYLAVRSDAQLSAARRWTVVILRLLIVTALILAIAGWQWRQPREGMNLFFALDRSDSIPSAQQEWAREYVNLAAAGKRNDDNVGVLVFGSQAGIESSPNSVVKLDKVHAVVDSERTDLSSAIRLATAAFPEVGQKRLVLLTDGNENVGDAYAAALAARPLDVSIDVLPLGVNRVNDVSIQKLTLPNRLKKGQPFEVKIFAEADHPTTGTLRLFRNDQLLGEQPISLAAGKNLYAFPQTLDTADFYKYDVQLDIAGDSTPQNNRAINFTNVRGDPRILFVSSDPEKDLPLAEALRDANLNLSLIEPGAFPENLAEMQSYDSIVLSNVAAGDLGSVLLKRLQSAVLDFGIGLVCLGGDQAYAAGGYRGTPLEITLPVDMELSSKKVLPSGALVMVMHGMEFRNGNQIARQTALGVLDALGPRDELGVVLWDGSDRWLFPLTKVGNKNQLASKIVGMNQGDLPSFQNVMTMAYEGLKKSTANLKHIIVFSDGDPGPPLDELMESIVENRITVSTVLIAGHAGPATMIHIAEAGGGRFYDVRSPSQLPQIFIKEASVILKSAIFEEPFQPQLALASEPVRGIGGDEYPPLLGYVATTAKPRAEVPLLTEKGDPLLAHWQYGLGRAVAFTSDTRAKWALNWVGWNRYRQFWTQVLQWSMRRIANADFTTEVAVENGEGVVSVEALDSEGAFRNFLDLRTVVVSPAGERETVRLNQSGPGRYEVRFPTREVGAYLLNLMEYADGQVIGSQVLGLSVNYSPEFNVSEPNLHLLQRLTEAGQGKLLGEDPLVDNPFEHDRQKTFQPRALWPWLLRFAILLFPIDIGIRRIQIDREEWSRAWRFFQRTFLFWRRNSEPTQQDESLAALLSRRDSVRTQQTRTRSEVRPPNPALFQAEAPRQEEQDWAAAAAPPADQAAENDESSESSAETGAPTRTTDSNEKEAPTTTTDRLLAAKRRAQKRRKS